MGKTNLLDAIYYTCMAKSHNTSSDRDVPQFEQEFFRLEAKLSDTDIRNVVIKVRPGEVKEISVDGKPVERLSDFVGAVPVVMLAPEDIVLVQGGSIARRRYMDIVLCQAHRSYMEALQRYNRLLTQRNAVFKKEGRLTDQKLLMTYTKSMIEPSLFIHEMRSKLCHALQPAVAKFYGMLSNAQETPNLYYRSHLSADNLETLAISSVGEDLHHGRTTKGIHRDDIDILLDDRMVKKYGSQGQIKSLLIALHLAQAEFLKETKGMPPLLLLDDIFDKLDEERSQRLVDMLTPDVAQQVFITDASQSRVARLIAATEQTVHIYSVDEGVVTKETVGANVDNSNLHTDEEE
jgi:DNA replication and repair protein RecF